MPGHSSRPCARLTIFCLGFEQVLVSIRKPFEGRHSCPFWHLPPKRCFLNVYWLAHQRRAPWTGPGSSPPAPLLNPRTVSCRLQHGGRGTEIFKDSGTGETAPAWWQHGKKSVGQGKAIQLMLREKQLSTISHPAPKVQPYSYHMYKKMNSAGIIICSTHIYWVPPICQWLFQVLETQLGMKQTEATARGELTFLWRVTDNS